MARPLSQTSTLALPPPDEQRWSIARGEYEGTPLIVRYNVTVGEWAGHAELPLKIGVAIPLNRPNAGGLPDPTENAELNQIEDIVTREVLSATRGAHVLVLTTGAMREFVFYAAAGADLAAVHTRIREQVSDHDVQCVAVEDPEWESYWAFAP